MHRSAIRVMSPREQDGRLSTMCPARVAVRVGWLGGAGWAFRGGAQDLMECSAGSAVLRRRAWQGARSAGVRGGVARVHTLTLLVLWWAKCAGAWEAQGWFNDKIGCKGCSHTRWMAVGCCGFYGKGLPRGWYLPYCCLSGQASARHRRGLAGVCVQCDSCGPGVHDRRLTKAVCGNYMIVAAVAGRSSGQW